jgi:Fe-S cluster assembly protein SufD
VHIGAGIGVNNATRNLFIAEPGSRAMIYESFISTTDSAYLTNSISEVFIAENASIEITKFVRENDRALHLGGLYCTLERNAALQHNNVALGAALVRNDLRINLIAPGGRVQLNGLHMTRDRQHVDNQITVEHRAAHCSSQQFYKGVLADHSRGVFAGRILVQVGAQKTDAQQTNHTLLLSKDADANTKPQLEIYADDVKCSHGATVGHLDDEAMFYLRSRGMGKQEARAALIQAFARDVINRIGDADIRDPIWHSIEQLQPG